MQAQNINVGALSPAGHSEPAASFSDAANALAASFLGWTLDAFDFFVFVFVLTKAAAEFHVKLETMEKVIPITLAFRPVGAFIFGLAADRFGRRRPMMANLVFFSAMEMLSGWAPNFTVFVIARALFGVGMGGEWGVGASLAMEKVPARWRGLLSGFLQQGYSTGYLLAACCYRFMPADWSWRTLFYIGGLPALLAIFIRMRVKESAVWQRHKHADWGQLWRGIARNWPLFLYLTLLMTMMNSISHGTQDLYPTFMERERGFTRNQRANVAILHNIGALLGGICFGLLSDKFGRRRSMCAALILALAIVPLWSGGATLGWLALGAFGVQFMVQGAWGVIPAHITELSPSAVRGFLPGFAYQCGVCLAGYVVAFQGNLAARLNSFSTAMAWTAVSVFIAGIAVIAFGPEKKGGDFTA
jgi:SHS family lactate transporter-like MFS transporter